MIWKDLTYMKLRNQSSAHTSRLHSYEATIQTNTTFCYYGFMGLLLFVS